MKRLSASCNTVYIYFMWFHLCDLNYFHVILCPSSSQNLVMPLLWTFVCVHVTNQNFVDRENHTHTFIGPFSGTAQVSRYHKGKTNLDFTKARDSEWQWHQLGCMQVYTSLQTDSHASTPPLSLLQATQWTVSKHWRQFESVTVILAEVVIGVAACHPGCLGSCSGPDNTDCASCREGYVHDEEQGCLGGCLCLLLSSLVVSCNLK